MSYEDKEVETGKLSDKGEENGGDNELENEQIEGGQIELEEPEAERKPIDSDVYTATSLPEHQKEDAMKTLPLTLNWAFGFNAALPVFSLLDKDRLAVLFCSAHVAVIYDHTSNSQHLLQGHQSPISCLCVSEDRRWLVTADQGQENLVIIWDSYTQIPVRTMFNCHPEGGVTALALSKDSKYLVTTGAGTVQRVCIWDWTAESEDPICFTDIRPEDGHQHHILFNPKDNSQLLSNSEYHVLFYTWDEGNMEYTAPGISQRTFKRAVGSLTQSIFNSEGVRAFSGTLAGNVVLWDALNMKATKLIPLQKEGFTVLTRCDSYIVTGDTKGCVKFYDEDFKLLKWYDQFNSDPIASISFSKELPTGKREEYQGDCTLSAKPFVIRNFVLSTSGSTVVHVKTRGCVVQTLLKEHVGSLEAVACHPSQPVVAMGSHGGLLKLWNYEQKVAIASTVYSTDNEIQCIVYDPQGFYLGVGFTSGEVQVLDACTLQEECKESFNYSKDCITHLTFSHDSSYLATADSGKAVTVYQRCMENSQPVWTCLGRHRSHYKPIQDLLFGVHLDSTQPRLISLGMDRRLVEYDLQNSRKGELLILNLESIEQSAVPTCMAWYPPMTTEHFLLVASDNYKLKLFNATTNMCRKTVLSPTYGSPLKKMLILPPCKDGDPKSHYVAYVTQDKVGVLILPLDGNPFKSLALMCHSTGVSGLACSCDGKYVFTAGGLDKIVFQWEISLPAFEAAAALGGKDLVPYYTLLEGGRDGALFKAIEDFFYYCQLRDQGINSMEKRQVYTHIPLTEVPFLIRAIGFYPTEQELEDMENEVKFSRYAETGKYVTDIDLEDFVKLYINHRPAFGLCREELYNPFKVLGESNESGQPAISRDELMKLLQSRGEHMTEEELAECFITLLGFGVEGGRCETGTFECEDSDAVIESNLPSNINADLFARDILGFSVSAPDPSP